MAPGTDWIQPVGERLRSLRSSARLRATVGAVALVALLLALGGAAVLFLLSQSLRDGVDSTLMSRADSRVRIIEAGLDPATLTVPVADETFVWIGRSDASTVATGGAELVDPRALVNGVAIASSVQNLDVTYIEIDFDESHGLTGDDEDEDYEGEDDDDLETAPMRVVSRQANPADGSDPLLIISGSDLSRVDRTSATARNILLVGFPIALLSVAAVTWAALGRAFGPVEGIRGRAAAITGARLDERVPVTGSGDEIDRLAHTMNDMLERLGDHDRRQRQFASDASHELKTPVANFRALVETADPARDGWPTVKGQLVDESFRLTELVDDLLYVSTRDEAGSAPNPTRVHLDDLVFDEAGALRARIAHKVDVGAVRPAVIDGVEADLRRAVRNLADNAGRHAESAVAFSISEEPGAVIVVVDDDGPGVEPANRELVFERFGRTDSARARGTGGTGLGLSIVRGIADRHGGTITVDDSPMGGARFSLRLPAGTR